MTSELRNKIKEVVQEYIECESPLHRISATQEDLADTLVDISVSLKSISKSLTKLADTIIPNMEVSVYEEPDS